MVYSEPPYYPRPVAIPMGNLALKLKMRDKAEAAFRIALDQYPGNFRAENGLRAASEIGSKPVNAEGAGGGN